MTSVPSHVTPLKLTQPASIHLEPGCPPAALAEPGWLGTPVSPSPEGVRRYLTDLSLPVRERSPRVLFRKAAFVDVGRVRSNPDGCQIEIGWQSSSLAPLFPVFAGHLTLTSASITLEGFYAPPGGEVGAVLDRAFLNIAARGTARWFLEQVEAALVPTGAPQPEARPSTVPAGDQAGNLNHGPAGRGGPGPAGSSAGRSTAGGPAAS
jgi:hypothetical protein